MFAAAFVVRPLGGLFFGPLGDRIGGTETLERLAAFAGARDVEMVSTPGNRAGHWRVEGCEDHGAPPGTRRALGCSRAEGWQ